MIKSKYYQVNSSGSVEHGLGMERRLGESLSNSSFFSYLEKSYRECSLDVKGEWIRASTVEVTVKKKEKGLHDADPTRLDD